MNHLKTFRQFIKEEDGMGTVEVILIIVVLVGLVVILKKRLRRSLILFSVKLPTRRKKYKSMTL